jgi:hypothetical protein
MLYDVDFDFDFFLNYVRTDLSSQCVCIFSTCVQGLWSAARARQMCQPVIPTSSSPISSTSSSSGIDGVNIAVGIYGFSTNMKYFTSMISKYWPNGIVGCVFIVDSNNDENDEEKTSSFNLPIGFKQCLFTPSTTSSKYPNINDMLAPSSSSSSSSSSYDNQEVKIAIIPLLLKQEFKDKDWYVVGDDSTVYSFDAMHQWLKNFDPTDVW